MFTCDNNLSNRNKLSDNFQKLHHIFEQGNITEKQINSYNIKLWRGLTKQIGDGLSVINYFKEYKGYAEIIPKLLAALEGQDGEPIKRIYLDIIAIVQIT